MTENPFDQSTLENRESAPLNNATGIGGVEARYSARMRTMVSGVVALSGVITPVFVFFAMEPPNHLWLAALIAVMEFSGAAFIWFLFNSMKIRADESGVSRTVLGRTQSVGWDEIQSCEESANAESGTQIVLRDTQDKILMAWSASMNDGDGTVRLKEYIAARIARNAPK